MKNEISILKNEVNEKNNYNKQIYELKTEISKLKIQENEFNNNKKEISWLKNEISNFRIEENENFNKKEIIELKNEISKLKILVNENSNKEYINELKKEISNFKKKEYEINNPCNKNIVNYSNKNEINELNKINILFEICLKDIYNNIKIINELRNDILLKNESNYNIKKTLNESVGEISKFQIEINLEKNAYDKQLKKIDNNTKVIDESKDDFSKLEIECLNEKKNEYNKCFENIEVNNFFLDKSLKNKNNYEIEEGKEEISFNTKKIKLSENNYINNINIINEDKESKLKIEKSEKNNIIEITINYKNKNHIIPINKDITKISLTSISKQIENSFLIKIDNKKLYYFNQFGKKIIIDNQNDFLKAINNKIFKFYLKDEKLFSESIKKQNFINENNIINKKIEEKEVIDHFISLNYLQNDINIEYYLNSTTYLSSLLKEINEQEIYNDKNENKFINPEEYCKLPGLIQEKKNPSEIDDYFILSLIAKILIEKGINVKIYKNKENINIDFSDISLKYIFTGLSEKNKYKIYFNIDNNRKDKLLEKGKELINFIDSWKTIISNELKLNKKDIFLVNPQNSNEEFSLDLISNEKNNIKNINLLEKNVDIKKIEEKCFIEGCQLSPDIFNHKYDNQDGGWGINQKRGGEKYMPPLGWKGYGLKIKNYDNGNDDWLRYDNRKGEFSVAYFSISNKNINDIDDMLKKMNEQIYRNDKDLRHQGEICGCGTYLFQDPVIAEKSAGIVDIGGVRYKILLMCRVNPDKIRQPSGFKNCWILNPCPNEIRPYRILIKKIFQSPISGASQNTIKIFKNHPKYYEDIIKEKDISFYETNKTKFNNNDYVINLYTSKDYKYINNYLREGKIFEDQYTLKQIKSWIYCLHCSLVNQKSVVSNGDIFYLGVTKKCRNTFGIGSEFIFSEFVSVTEDKNMALSFACNGTLFIIRIENNQPNSYCNKIDNISCFKNEKEILITSNCTFEVTEIENGEKEDDLDTVHLTCKGYKMNI